MRAVPLYARNQEKPKRSGRLKRSENGSAMRTGIIHAVTQIQIMGISDKRQNRKFRCRILSGVINMFIRIRQLREDRDLKQREIAGLLHISQATYSDYESGKLSISIEALIELAKFYGTSVEYIVGLTDKAEPYR